VHRIEDSVENELGSAGDEWDYSRDKGLGRELAGLSRGRVGLRTG
jgi:hypothetical protein